MTTSDVQDQHKKAYTRYIGLLNQQDFEHLSEVVDPEKYREICVGFTPGWVGLQDAITSLKRVLKGIPDLNAHIDDLVAEEDRVYARLTVTGTNSGPFYGLPASGGSYQVNMFDYARFENGRIVERMQQSDSLGQFRQMYGPVARQAGLVALGLAGVGVVLSRFRRA